MTDSLQKLQAKMERDLDAIISAWHECIKKYLDLTCNHITLRRWWLPCPHPDCWSAKAPHDLFVFPERQTWRPISLFEVDPMKAQVKCLLVRRMEFQISDKESYWGWREEQR